MKKQLQIAALMACAYAPGQVVRRLINNVKAYPINYAGAFWVSSVSFLAFAPELGGAEYEGIGGRIMLTGELSALFLGKFRYTYNLATAAFVSGTLMQRGPEFISHPWRTLATLGTMVALNAPAILEPWFKEKAQVKLKEFQSTGKSTLRRIISEGKRKAFWCFSNPRTTALNTNAIYITTSLATVTAAAVHGNQFHDLFRYLGPFYGLMLTGNRIATLSENQVFSPPPLSRRHLARQKYFEHSFEPKAT